MAFVRSYHLNNGMLNKSWPLYRGKRAGKLVKSRQAISRYKIDIVKPRATNHANEIPQISRLSKTHNPTNCVYINPLHTTQSTNSLGKTFVPGVLLSNVMSLAPKIDEVRHCVTHANVDVVCLTETWLREHIHNNVVSINGFNLVRLDRKTRIHGCVYIYQRFYSIFHIGRLNRPFI